jgi:hypothetical protein
MIPQPADCGSRPCPACSVNGTPTGTDADGHAPCRACLGTLWHPYPWTLPEDEADGCHVTRRMFSREESAIICAAPSNLLAYVGYCAVYGPVRSYRQIKGHREFRRNRAGWEPIWSERALEALERESTFERARAAVHAVQPDIGVTDAAIERRFHRMHKSGP